MGKYFISKDELIRVSHPDSQWTDIKAEFTQKDRDYILNALMQTKAISNGKDVPQTEVEMNLGKQVVLERAIVAWSFTDDQGHPVPVDSENISNLKTRYREQIISEIDNTDIKTRSFLAFSKTESA